MAKNTPVVVGGIAVGLILFLLLPTALKWIAIIAVIAYLASWALLHVLWRRQSPVLRPILIATAVLIALGVLGTLPTFFQAFASE
jgi:hypothetical protein